MIQRSSDEARYTECNTESRFPIRNGKKTEFVSDQWIIEDEIPLIQWFEEFSFLYKMGKMNLTEIKELRESDPFRFYFYAGLLNGIGEQEEKRIKEKEKAMKAQLKNVRRR